MKKTYFLKTLFVAACLLVGVNAWADDWTTIWEANFSTAPSGMTYSVTNGSVDISTGVLFYHQGGGSGDRAINTAFTADAFNVDTNWQMEFDWGASSANTNASNVVFATNKGTAFTITWAKYATTVTISDANGSDLTTTLPIDGYNKATMTNLSHFTITGDTENGIYLTVTNGVTTYVNNVLVSSTYGYPKTFNGSLGRAVSHMALDNIVFKTPYVSGFVPTPSSTLTGAYGTSRKFTLSCTDPDATIYYSETELAANADGWIEYTGEVTTAASTIYAIAKKDTDVSDVYSFSTGAGTTITLNTPIVSVTNMIANGSFYNASFNATYNASGVEFTPSATLSATFTPEGGVATTVDLPYTATIAGTLTITASSEGFTSAQTVLNVAEAYSQSWQSYDFSSITGEQVASALGENWTLQDGSGRWASWKDQTYTYYSDGSTSNITTNDRLRMRGVISLNVGYGLGRNISGTEAITVLSTSEGEIVSFQMYNGHGNYAVADASYYSYALNNGSSPSIGTNAGALLVQATVYSPVEFTSATITAAGYATLYTDKALDFSTTGLTAYIAKVGEKKGVEFEAVTTIPANTGVLLKGDADNYRIPVLDSSDTNTENNLFEGVLEATVKSAGIFVLMAPAEKPVGFYKTINDFTVGANTAYRLRR